MGKTSYKGLRVNYQPKQKVKVMLGRDWFDAQVVKANKKTVVVNTLFSRTKYRKVQIDQSIEGSLGKPTSVLEPYTVSGTRVVKLPRIRVKPIEGQVIETPSTIGACTALIHSTTPATPERCGMISRTTEAMIENTTDEPKTETKPETAADVLAELEKMLE